MDISTVFQILEHVGVLAFAISGALVAIDNETDIFGVIFLSFITSFGGGIIRDLCLGLPVPLFFTPNYTSLLLVCLVTSLAVFFFAMLFKNRFVKNEKLLDTINNYIDAVGLGAFAVAGAKLTIAMGYKSPFMVIMMGMTCCIGGGMLRDIMLNQIPFVLRKRIYALAAAAGSGAYYLLWVLSVDDAIAMVIGAFVTIAIRVLATVFKWNMPRAINFSTLRAQLDVENEKECEEEAKEEILK